MSRAFPERAGCANVPDSEAIPTSSMLPSLSSLFSGWPANSIPDAPDPVKEATPENSSPPMQASGGGESVLIAVQQTAASSGACTYKLMEVFSDGSYSAVGDDVAAIIIGKW